MTVWCDVDVCLLLFSLWCCGKVVECLPCLSVLLAAEWCVTPSCEIICCLQAAAHVCVYQPLRVNATTGMAPCVNGGHAAPTVTENNVRHTSLSCTATHNTHGNDTKPSHCQTRENSTAQVVTQHSSPLTTRKKTHTSARRPTNEPFSEVNARNAHAVAQGRSSSGTVF